MSVARYFAAEVARCAMYTTAIAVVAYHNVTGAPETHSALMCRAILADDEEARVRHFVLALEERGEHEKAEQVRARYRKVDQ